MTDAEILCQFMEPKPTERPRVHGANELWWRWGWRYIGPSLPQQETPHEYCWLPRRLTLDAIWEIEERLTEEQQWAYGDAIRYRLCASPGTWHHLHVDAPTRIRALASVLRSVVKARAGEPGE